MRKDALFILTDLMLKISVTVIKKYLSSYCTIGLSWGRRFKNSLLLLWWQCGIQRNDFDITNFRSKVIHLTFDPFAGLINFLKD